MQKVNPFTPGINQFGRKNEEARFEELLGRVRAGTAEALAITSVRGMGKTYLLEKFAGIARRSNTLTISTRAQKGEGVGDILKKIANELQRSLEEINETSAMPIGALRLAIFSGKGNAHVQYEKAYSVLKNYFEAIAILIDNAEKLKPGTINELARIVEKLAQENMPYFLVFSYSGGLKITGEKIREIRVPPLRDTEMKKAIEGALKPHGLRMGDECLAAIMADSQGHPLVFLITCWILFDRMRENEKIISKGHYVRNRDAIIDKLGQELFDELYDKASASERNIVVALAQMGEVMRVRDIATYIKSPINTVTTLIARLTEDGVVEREGRGKYKLFNPLFGGYVLKRANLQP